MASSSWYRISHECLVIVIKQKGGDKTEHKIKIKLCLVMIYKTK
jgi:hypothetical protein